MLLAEKGTNEGIGNNMKTCSRCGETKPKEIFTRYNVCKKCAKEYLKQWCIKNADRIKKKQQKKYILHKEEYNKNHARYYELNKEKIKQKVKEYRIINYDKILLSDKKRRQTPEHKQKWYKEYKKERFSNNMRFRLNHLLSASIRVSLRKGKQGLHWEKLVGYTLDALIKHLEKQFKDGMSWDNAGKWHIDHVVPISAFNFETAEDLDFQRCWGLSNLRPMWAEENLKKHAKLSKPFQPALAIGMR